MALQGGALPWHERLHSLERTAFILLLLLPLVALR